MVACNWPALTKVVTNWVGFPLQLLQKVTVEEPLTKFDPLTVRVKGLVVPAGVLVGEIEVTPDALMVKLTALDATMLSESLTVRLEVPAEVSKLAGTVAVIEVPELAMMVNGVVVAPAVQFTIGEVVGKPVPPSVRLNAPCPAVAVEGVRVLRTGLAAIVKVAVVGPVPVPLLTPTWALPAAASRLLGMTAVNWVGLT
jgi:hypothetical protein